MGTIQHPDSAAACPREPYSGDFESSNNNLSNTDKMRRQPELSLLSLITFFPVLPFAAWDCGKIVTEGKEWNLSKLGGPHSVYHTVDHYPTISNTTFALDICKPLTSSKCVKGTFVCGTEHITNGNDTGTLSKIIPIAGSYQTSSGRALDPTLTRLKSSDSQKEGIRIELHGGKYGKRKQQAVIEMLCDRDRTGLDDEDAKSRKKRTNDDEKKDSGKEGDGKEEKKKPSLQFKSYGPVDDVDVLRLDWLTKYACEDVDDDGKPSNHWGFFTWLIIILFLCTAAYLIFGSWLNYNRYGARGWDLLPHGDTIRDIPYIMKDWGRRVVSTIQGPGSRGGYSAV